MNAIIVTSSYPLHPDDSAAAAGLFVREFALEAAKQGHNVKVLTQRRSGPFQNDPGLPVVRYRWIGNRPLSTLRPARPWHLIAILSVLGAGLKALDELVVEEMPDLIIAMWAVPAGLMARLVSMRRGVPYRVWVLGSDIWDYGRKAVTRPFVRFALRGAERVFADGLALGAEAREIAQRTCDFVPSARKLPTGMPKPVELDPEKKNFVFIGRFHENKGADLLVESVAALGTDVLDRVHFFLFGGGPEETALRDQIRRKGLRDKLVLMGYANRERSAAFLEHCDAVIVPSRIESIPVVLSDAARAGCPSIVTAVGDMATLVERTGCGIVVHPDVRSIQEGIIKMADRNREDFQAGCAALASEFSLVNSVKTVLG